MISGPHSAGKSSVAAALCERFDRMLLVEVDELRQMVRAGFRHATAQDHQAQEQLELGCRNAASIALESAAARYSTVIVDLVTAEMVTWYRDALAATPVRVELITLLPDLEIILSRDANRGKDAMGHRVSETHALLSTEFEGSEIPGAVLDTASHLNAHESADAVQDVISRGQALLLEPQ